MKPSAIFKIRYIYSSRALLAIILSLLLIISSGCSFSIDNGSSGSNDLAATQVSLNQQETQIAQKVNDNIQATLAAQQAAIEAQVAQQQAADMAATQVALSVQATVAAAQPAPAVEAPPVVVAPPADVAAPAVPPVEPQPVAPVQPEAPVDVSALMKSANIMIYEDMVNDPGVYPYVKRTLDKMGLPYKNNGSAKGWLKNDMLIGAKGGVPWDLIVIAVEFRGGISGEYFDYVNDVLNKGTSVIIEAYHLDQVSQGTVSTILARCGISIKNYIGKTQTLTDMVVWPISGASPHPILNEPNSGLSFTKAVFFWPFTDLGDLMTLTGQGDGQLLLGRHADSRTTDGTLATCLNGQLTLMTMSSHSYSFQTIMPLWENMIYQALKYRFTNFPQ